MTRTFMLTHVRVVAGETVRDPWPIPQREDRAAFIVRNTTGQDAADSIARLDAGVRTVTIPYLNDATQGVEVTITG